MSDSMALVLYQGDQEGTVAGSRQGRGEIPMSDQDATSLLDQLKAEERKKEYIGLSN